MPGDRLPPPISLTNWKSKALRFVSSSRKFHFYRCQRRRSRSHRTHLRQINTVVLVAPSVRSGNTDPDYSQGPIIQKDQIRVPLCFPPYLLRGIAHQEMKVRSYGNADELKHLYFKSGTGQNTALHAPPAVGYLTVLVSIFQLYQLDLFNPLSI